MESLDLSSPQRKPKKVEEIKIQGRKQGNLITYLGEGHEEEFLKQFGAMFLGDGNLEKFLLSDLLPLTSNTDLFTAKEGFEVADELQAALGVRELQHDVVLAVELDDHVTTLTVRGYQ